MLENQVIKTRPANVICQHRLINTRIITLVRETFWLEKLSFTSESLSFQQC